MHKPSLLCILSSLGLSSVLCLPLYAQSTTSKPATPRSTVTAPAVTKPTVAKPAVTKPAVTKPVVPQPVGTQPVGTQPSKAGVAKPKVPTVPPKTNGAQSTQGKPAATTPAVKGEPTGKDPNLEVTFKALRTSTGQVCLSLFSGPKGFPKGGADSDLVVSKCSPVVNSAATFMFSDLKPGNYAVTAFHDANNDGKMNKTDFGMPEEGFGFSNNPAIGFSAPSFDETKFPVSVSKSVVAIEFKYLN